MGLAALGSPNVRMNQMSQSEGNYSMFQGIQEGLSLRSTSPIIHVNSLCCKPPYFRVAIHF